MREQENAELPLCAIENIQNSTTISAASSTHLRSHKLPHHPLHPRLHIFSSPSEHLNPPKPPSAATLARRLFFADLYAQLGNSSMDRNRYNGIFGWPYSGLGRQSPVTQSSPASRFMKNGHTARSPGEDYHYSSLSQAPYHSQSSHQSQFASYQNTSHQYGTSHHSPTSPRPHSTLGSPTVVSSVQHFAHEHNPALSSGHSEIAQWLRFQPLSILQLDPADRVVLFIAGK